MTSQPWMISLCTFCLLLPNYLPAADARAKVKGKVATQKPQAQAVLVAMESYETLPDLEQSLACSLKLATRLIENEIGVTFITQTSLRERAEKALPEKGVTIVLADTAEELESRLIEWRTAQFQTPGIYTPFGFVVCAGHGVRRWEGAHPRDYFLTASDTNEQGGVCIQQVSDQFGKGYLPVVFVMDICRGEVGQPGQAAPQAKRRSANPSLYDDLIETAPAVTISREHLGTIAPVLTLWSTQPGKAAHDSGSFLEGLAVGLERIGKTFAARDAVTGVRRSPTISYSPLEGPQDLSLFTWYFFAKQYVGKAHSQDACLSEGLVDPMMICASCRADYVPAPPPMDLLSVWNRFPDTAMRPQVLPAAVEVLRPQGMIADPKLLFAVSFFEQPTPQHWQGKTLVVEAVAEKGTAHGRMFLGCLINPGDNTNGTSLRTDWNTKVWEIPYHTTRRVYLPLQGDAMQEFKSLATSPPAHDLTLWPEGDRLRVSRITLVDNKDLPKLGMVEALRGHPNGVMGMAKPELLDLLPRWWSMEVKHPSSTTAVAAAISRVAPDNARVLTMKFSENQPGYAAGQGGSVYHPPFVQAELYKLRVSVASATPLKDSEHPQAQIVIQDGGDNLLVGKLAVSPTKKQYEFNFAASGFPERIYVLGTDVEEIKIAEITLVPR